MLTRHPMGLDSTAPERHVCAKLGAAIGWIVSRLKMRDLPRTSSRIIVALLFLTTSVCGSPVTQQQAAKAAETFLVRFYPAASDKLAQTVRNNLDTV